MSFVKNNANPIIVGKTHTLSPCIVIAIGCILIRYLQTHGSTSGNAPQKGFTGTIGKRRWSECLFDWMHKRIIGLLCIWRVLHSLAAVLGLNGVHFMNRAAMKCTRRIKLKDTIYIGDGLMMRATEREIRGCRCLRRDVRVTSSRRPASRRPRPPKNKTYVRTYVSTATSY